VITKARYAASFAALLWIVQTRPSSAADRVCAQVAVEADADLRARWPELSERVRLALEGRDDVDGCARIVVSVDRALIVLKVVLPDGRSASRSVSRREDVVPTLEALLLLPREKPQAADSEPPRQTKTGAATAVATNGQPAAPPVTKAIVLEHAEPATAALAQPSRFRLEFSLAAGTRAGDGQVGVSLGAVTFFDIAGWLLGFQAEADSYGVTGGPGGAALQLAILGGRRFRFGGTSLDVTAGPALALRGIGSSTSMSVQSGSNPGAMPPAMNDGPWTRIHCGARLNFRARSTLRTFVGIDGDFGTARVATDVPTEEPRLPLWTVGLIVGATVGTP
jgi:hypothetical protein